VALDPPIFVWNTTLPTGGIPFLSSSPTVDDNGDIYVAFSNSVTKINGRNGIPIWVYITLNINQFSSVAIGTNSTVYVGTVDGLFWALDQSLGTLKWNTLLHANIRSSALVGPDGTVYIGSNDQRIYALSSVDGSQKWTFITGGVINSSPSYYNGTLYVASHDENLYALDELTGAERWRIALFAAIESTPVIDIESSTVYIGTQSLPPTPNFFAIDLNTGALKWNFTAATQVRSTPAIGANGLIYVASFTAPAVLYALDKFTGELRLNTSISGPFSSSPAIGAFADGRLYFGDQNGIFYILDGSNFTTRWTFNAEAALFSSPSISDLGLLYFANKDGKVFCFQSCIPIPTPSSTSTISPSPSVSASFTASSTISQSRTPTTTPTPNPSSSAKLPILQELSCTSNKARQSCEDNDVCTVDYCREGDLCVHQPVVCNDNDPCTRDACSPELGCVFTPIENCEEDDCRTKQSCSDCVSSSCAWISCVPDENTFENVTALVLNPNTTNIYFSSEDIFRRFSFLLNLKKVVGFTLGDLVVVFTNADEPLIPFQQVESYCLSK